MAEKLTYEMRRIICPEEGRKSELFVEWMEKNGTQGIRSVCCDNPRFASLDNWDCQWSCLTQLQEGTAEGWPS